MAPMLQVAANSLRQLITPVVIVCLSLCCCQVNILFCGESESSNSTTVRTASSCCSDQCPSNAPTEPADDDHQAPLKSCQSCCVKGTGLKETITLPGSEIVAFALNTVCSDEAVARPPQTKASTTRLYTANLRVDVPTLLRLHCALII